MYHRRLLYLLLILVPVCCRDEDPACLRYAPQIFFINYTQNFFGLSKFRHSSSNCFIRYVGFFYLHCIKFSSSNSQWRSIHAILRGVTHKIVDSNNLLCLKTQAKFKSFLIVCFLQSLWRRANARNVSFFYSLRWPIYVFNPVVNNKLPAPQKVTGS